MPRRPKFHESLLGAISLTIVAALVSTGSAFGSEDTTPPELKALRFSPPEIQTSTGPAEVTITFTVTDDASGVHYFEAAFVDPTGVVHRSAASKFGPNRSLTDSTKITFPRFSIAGEWTLSHVFLSDAAGNTLFLDNAALIRAGFPARLEVRSAKDTVSPKLTALEFSPAEIDTATGPASVKVNVTATDDLSGVSYFEMTFSSPSGVVKRNATAKFEPAVSVTHSLTLTFPARSEPGTWTLSTLFLADAAGNTLVLDAPGIGDLGFRTTLEVKSAADTRSPELGSIRFSPEAVDTSQGEAVVTVEFKATDDLSGVKFFEAAFTNPSGSMSYKGSVVFPQPSKEVAGSVQITIPKSSESGIWTLSTVMLTDDAGNSLVLDADMLGSRVGKLQVR